MTLVFTKHAIERFKQRTRLLQPEFYMNPKRYMKYFIENGKRELRLDLYPFYRNKMGITHVIVNGKFKFYMVNNVVITFVYNGQDWRY